MGERKVLNKYFPPDFDPSKVPRGKRVRSEEKQMKVRMMLPMSVRCNTCGNFMYKGTKFNTRMEDVKGEAYLGIKIFRFYYRCTNCSAEFCMKTDPKTADYVVEGGATRNYEPWRDKEASAAAVAAAKEEEEKGDAMKALENRTKASKREMDLLTALDEMRSLKAAHEAVGADEALAALRRAAEGEEPADLDAEDEEAVRQMLLERAGFVRRLSDSDEERERGGGVGEGDGGGGAKKRQRKEGGRPAGAGARSAAVAAWEEEGDESEAAAAAAEAERERIEREKAEGGGSGDGVQAAGAAPPAAAVVPPKPKASLAKPPPSVPSFAVRPAAVVVKRKPAAAAAPQPVEKKEESGDGSGGLAGLLGGYGSSDSE